MVRQKRIGQEFRDEHGLKRISDAEHNATTIAGEIARRNKFIAKCKNSSNVDVFVDENGEQADVGLKYFKEIQRNKVLDLPVLDKIQLNKRLDLRGYGLNEGVCRSLATAL